MPAWAVPSANWIPPPDWVQGGARDEGERQRERQEEREDAPGAHRPPPCDPATGAEAVAGVVPQGRAVLVHGLPLVVVVGVQLAVGPGDRLGRLVRLEAPVERLVLLRHLAVSASLVAEHQIVVCLQVLGVDGQHLLQLGDRVRVLPLQEEQPADLVPHHAVPRVERRRLPKVRQRLVVAARLLERGAEEEVRLGETGVHLEGLAERLLRAREVSLGQPRAADVHPPVRVGGLHLRDVQEGRLRAQEVALEKQADPVVVPPLADGRVEEGGRLRLGRSLRQDPDPGLPLVHDGDGDVRDGLDLARDARRVAGEDPAAVVVAGPDRVALVLRVADAREGPLRVPPRELAVVELRLHRDPVAAVLGNAQAVVHGVGGAGRDEPHVGHRPRGPGVPLVHDVAVLVEHQAAIEVGPRLDRALLPVRGVLGEAGVEDLLPVRVDDLELDPDVERVHRAAREEVADPARPHHHVEPGGVAPPQRRVHLVERGHHLGRRRDEGPRGAEAHRLLARGERRAEPGLCARRRRASRGARALPAPGRTRPASPRPTSGRPASPPSAPRRG